MESRICLLLGTKIGFAVENKFKIHLLCGTNVGSVTPSYRNSEHSQYQDLFSHSRCALLYYSFPDRFPHNAWTSIVSPFQLHWVKGACMFRCGLPPALLAEWLVSFMCHCCNTRVEQTLNKGQHRDSELWRRKLSPSSCRTRNLSQPLNRMSGNLTIELSQHHCNYTILIHTSIHLMVSSLLVFLYS